MLLGFLFYLLSIVNILELVMGLSSKDVPFQTKLTLLKDLLLRDFTNFWPYKDIFFSPAQIGASPQLIQKSTANLGNGCRLRRLLINAMKGQDISMPIVGGSISRGAPFAEQGEGARIYFHAIEEWWSRLFMDISGSKLVTKSISLGGIGTDYYSYCLDPHLVQDFTPELFIWELSANDKGRYTDKPFSPGQPLEQFVRNVMQRYSRPALILLNFFRGADITDNNCPNYEDEGEFIVASRYNITSLSWRNYVCDYIKNRDPYFGADHAFSIDGFHPSILGHAQMAFIVINHLRNEFLRALRGPAGLAQSIEEFALILNEDIYVLPPVIFPETSSEKPLCFTYLRYNEYEPNNTLVAQVTRQDNYKFNIFKQFIIRTDKLGGMQTDVSEQLIQYSIYLPRYFSRLIVVSHAEQGAAQVWLDRQTPVLISTEQYHMGTLLILVSTNIQPGRHVLNALSLKNGFVICALAVI